MIRNGGESMIRFQLYDDNGQYRESERWWVYSILMGVSGFYGAFTYSIRGGVFCNAQTANFVLFAMAVGDAHWSKALYYLIPMTAYFLGAFLTELAFSSPGWRFPLHWETMLIGIEMCFVVVLGLIPETAPYQISQVIINFLCSMQYNTFRAAQGIPMATTFCTNHLRQTGIACCKAIRSGDVKDRRRMYCHLEMIGAFVVGGILSTILCRRLLGRAIWVTLIPLALLLAYLIRADLVQKKAAAD